MARRLRRRGRLRVSRALALPGVAASAAVLLAGAGALSSLETGQVRSFGQGLWWAVSLMTTVGFVGAPPTTTAGIVVSGVLMVTGFALLALVSAALASLFVRDDSTAFEAGERSADAEILRRLGDVQERLAALERGGGPRRPDDR